MRPPEAESRPGGSGFPDDDHGGGNVLGATVAPAGVKGPRCKFLHPSYLTGCRQLAEPGSVYCAIHGGAS
jgi:hypothetical protein